MTKYVVSRVVSTWRNARAYFAGALRRILEIEMNSTSQ